MEEKRWCFVRDDDGHWYLIPLEDQEEFYNDLEKGEEDYWCDFNNKWEGHRETSPAAFSFSNPHYEW